MQRYLPFILVLICVVMVILLAPKPKTPSKAPTSTGSHYPTVSERTPSSPRPEKIVPPSQVGLGKDLTEACADCHPDHVDGFKSTGMGNSLYSMHSRTFTEPWTIEASKTVHDATQLTYTAYRSDDGKYWQEESHPSNGYKFRVEATIAIGSGNHTRSFLGHVDGELVQLPLTYYVDSKRWDLSPGYHENNQRMGRPVTPKCLYCHNDTSKLVPDTVASYQGPLANGISCNRCHGDGQRHISYRLDGNEPESGAPDTTILNPKHLPRHRQQQLCEQCHLQGRSRRLEPGHSWDDYSPKTPLHEYMTIHVEQIETDSFGIASHGARLQMSKCYESGNLGCATCHNPHKPSSKAEYISDCKNCHESGCDEPKHTQGYCPECHMPKDTPSDIPHVQFSDHYIRVDHADTSNRAREGGALIDPHGPLRQQTKASRALRLAVGYFDDMDAGGSQIQELSRSYVSTHLADAVTKVPDNWNGWDALAKFAFSNRDYAQASTALEEMMKLKPDPQTRLRLVRSLAMNGEQLRAKALLDVTPNHIKFLPLYGHALAAFKSDLPTDKVEELEYFTTTHPAVEDATLTIATKALSKNANRKARQILSRSLTNDPQQPKARFLDATLAFDERDYRRALAQLTRVLDTEPTLDAGRWLRARCYLKLNQDELALTDLKMVAKNQPSNEAILNDYLSVVRRMRGQSELRLVLDALASTVPAEILKRLRSVFLSPTQAPTEIRTP